MDAKRFDQMAKTVSALGSRRVLVQALVTLPLVGWLSLFLDEEGAAKGRHHREKGRGTHRGQGRGKGGNVGAANHKHEHRRRKHRNKGNHGHHQHDDKKQPCKPQSAALTCDGQCGMVQNNCKKAVDCGSCVCDPACPACQTCDPTSGQCQADPGQNAASCAGCRVCDNGECIPDATIVCTASDQCHEAGVCDPATGTCTNPPKANDTPCDDDDPCTTNDSCQNGECRGTPKDCSAEGDVCNDGVCRADGTCIKRAKPNGTGCNADNNSCTPGDSCQNGVCTAGAGVDCSALDDACNTGVCGAADGQCVKSPKDDGTPCGAGAECIGGSCETTCLALGALCTSADECCGDGSRACNRPRPTGPPVCCVPVGGTCSATDSHCCGIDFGVFPDGPVYDSDIPCVNGTCCQRAGDACRTVADCCEGEQLQCLPSIPGNCTQPGVTLCCRPLGAPCTSFCQCCNATDVGCVGGFCTQVDPP